MARKPLRILCFGDSLTSGYFCFGMDSHPYSLKLEDKLTGALPGVDVETVTNGVPGDVATFKRFTDRMRDECGCPFPLFPCRRSCFKSCPPLWHAIPHPQNMGLWS